MTERRIPKGFAPIRYGLLDHLAVMGPDATAVYLWCHLRASYVGAGTVEGSTREIAAATGMTQSGVVRAMRRLVPRYLEVERASAAGRSPVYRIARFRAESPSARRESYGLAEPREPESPAVHGESPAVHGESPAVHGESIGLGNKEVKRKTVNGKRKEKSEKEKNGTPDALIAGLVEAELRALEATPARQPPLALPPWLPQADWADYLAMRQRIRKPATRRACELAIARLDAMRASGQDPGEVLRQSVLHSWQGLFVVHEDRVNGRTAKTFSELRTEGNARAVAAVEAARAALERESGAAGGELWPPALPPGAGGAGGRGGGHGG